VFGPASAWRSEIVPRVQEGMVALLHAGQHGTTAEGGQPASGFADPLGAELPLRVFREDVLLCSCGGRRVVLAFITEKRVVQEISCDDLALCLVVLDQTESTS